MEVSVSSHAIGGTQRLPKLVGAGKAKEMIFTAKVVSGQEAHDIGLVEQVVPANEDCNAAYLKALEIAKEICTKVLQCTSHEFVDHLQ